VSKVKQILYKVIHLVNLPQKNRAQKWCRYSFPCEPVDSNKMAG
jgi:hypothetical protein